MFKDEFDAMVRASESKCQLLEKNPPGYFVLSMMAGAFIGFGVLLTNSIGAQLQGSPFTKLILGLAFGVALSLVTMAGGELFTGNNMVIGAGLLTHRVTLPKAIRIYSVCWLGNLCGGIVLGLLFLMTGLSSGATGDFMAAATLSKITAPPLALFARGALCNMLVCLAVWCGFRAKSDAGKLIMIFWCLFAFVTTGFEHSVANMTLFTEALINPCGQPITLVGCLYNLLLVSAGNLFGGILLVACPYYIASQEPHSSIQK